MENDLMEFKVGLEELWDCIIAHNSSKNIARHGSCRVAVALMVDRSYYCLLKAVEVLNRTVDSNGKSFFCHPSLTNCFDVLNIRCS